MPNLLVLAGGGLVLVRVVSGCLATDERLADLIAAALLGLLTSGAELLFVMWLVRPEWIGGGDWKLLAVIGASLGIVDARAAFVALSPACSGSRWRSVELGEHADDGTGLLARLGAGPG